MAKGLCSTLQGAPVTLQTMHPFGSGGTISNNNMLEPFKELGLDSQRVKKLASKLHVHTVDYAAKLVHTRRAFPALVNSH